MSSKTSTQGSLAARRNLGLCDETPLEFSGIMDENRDFLICNYNGLRLELAKLAKHASRRDGVVGGWSVMKNAEFSSECGTRSAECGDPPTPKLWRTSAAKSPRNFEQFGLVLTSFDLFDFFYFLEGILATDQRLELQERVRRLPSLGSYGEAEAPGAARDEKGIRGRVRERGRGGLRACSTECTAIYRS